MMSATIPCCKTPTASATCLLRTATALIVAFRRISQRRRAIVKVATIESPAPMIFPQISSTIRCKQPPFSQQLAARRHHLQDPKHLVVAKAAKDARATPEQPSREGSEEERRVACALAHSSDAQEKRHVFVSPAKRTLSRPAPCSDILPSTRFACTGWSHPWRLSASLCQLVISRLRDHADCVGVHDREK